MPGLKVVEIHDTVHISRFVAQFFEQNLEFLRAKFEQQVAENRAKFAEQMEVDEAEVSAEGQGHLSAPDPGVA